MGQLCREYSETPAVITRLPARPRTGIYGCSGCPAPLGSSPLPGKQHPPASALSDGRSLSWCARSVTATCRSQPASGSTGHEQVLGPVALVLVIKPLPPTCLGRDGRPLLGLPTAWRSRPQTTRGVIGFRIEVQHVLHAPRTRRSPWGCTTHFFRHGLSSFFSAPAWPSPGRWSRSTPASPPRRPAMKVQRVCPSGTVRAGHGHQVGFLLSNEFTPLSRPGRSLRAPATCLPRSAGVPGPPWPAHHQGFGHLLVGEGLHRP